MSDIPGSETISTRQQTIATRARQAPELSFTSLNHYIDLAWLYEAYRRTRKDGAPGVDGQTAAAYADNLEANLKDLLDRAKSGRYRAPAVKRAYIPKGNGSTTRPIGVPTFEDKIVQRAVVMVLEPIYEQDFLDCSYGFRPSRSAHQALEVWRNSYALSRFLHEVKRRWCYWLNRRSDRRHWTWDRFAQYVRQHPLPPPISVHSVLRHAAKP
jgi:hypothetical protein